MRQIILYAIVSLCFAASVFGQAGADRVIVQGEPALTQGMLDLSRQVFEFAFGGELNETERAGFEREISKRWQSDPEAVKVVQELVALQGRATNMSKDQLPALQKQLQGLLTNDLRGQVDKDPLAKLLIGAYDRISGLNARQGGDLPVPSQYQEQQRTQSAPGGSIPRELLGEWVESHSSNTTYTNGYGGYAAPSGEKIILHFFADGTYKGAYYVQSSMSYGCTMNVFMPSSGVWRFEDNTLKLNERASHTISKDSCTTRYNYEKDNKPGTYAYPARLETDQYGTKIVLTMNDGPHNFYVNTGKSFLSGN